MKGGLTMSNYKKVYFRIRTPMYYNPEYGLGFSTPEDAMLFDKTIAELFLNDGWTVKEKKFKDSCNRVVKKKQELYLHPQSVSGVVLEENIPHIEQLLSNSSIFEFKKTDIYEDVFDITDEEYMNILKSKQAEIEKDILIVYKTKRRNLYITDTWTPLNKVLDKYRIKRLSNYSSVISSNNIDFQYITELFEDLIKQNKIVTAKTKHGIGYRTNKELLLI